MTEWSVLAPGRNGPLHAVPRLDRRKHDLSLHCWCRPTNNGLYVVHKGYEDDEDQSDPPAQLEVEES